MTDFHEATRSIFEKYKENYVKVFRRLYPAKNSTGFPERNLSVNFSKAVECLFPESSTWFEFQFGEKNNLHFDAVVIIPELKRILIIEAKRFSNPPQKAKEIHHDMLRVGSVASEYYKEFADRIPDFSAYSVSGVILADVWTETDVKTAIKDSFLNCCFLETFIPSLPKDFFRNGSYHVRGFEDATDYPCINTNYYLVSMIWDVIADKNDS